MRSRVRVAVPRSARKVRKLCTGRPSSVFRRAFLRLAAGEIPTFAATLARWSAAAARSWS
jgi:hypothetical protein